MLQSNLIKDLKDLLKIFRPGGLRVYVTDHLSQIAEMRKLTCNETRFEVDLPNYGKVNVYQHGKRMKLLFERDYKTLINLDGEDNTNPTNMVMVNALESSVNTRFEFSKLLRLRIETHHWDLTLDPATIDVFDKVMLDIHQTIQDLDLLKHGIYAFKNDAMTKTVFEYRQGIIKRPIMTL